MPKITDILTTADRLKAHCETLDGFDSVRCVVNRQKDIEAEVSAAVGKAGGSLLFIDLLRGQPESEGSLAFDHTYLLSLWSLPVLAQEGDDPASVKLATLINELTNWKPQPTTQPLSRFVVTEWGITPSKNYQIYALTLKLREQF
ncbi:MAG TPA: hypothetical protein DEA90_16250 [Opitutae bacterium]|nr:hypothetical protein [Puniceicoccaceae bacterium]HBR95709.1 hypothetical protein [Opitutae bacterium]|tara:strand:+ start:90 stop:524 length:435 start_codon:yes stop_codon:yes gene_type:complete